MWLWVKTPLARRNTLEKILKKTTIGGFASPKEVPVGRFQPTAMWIQKNTTNMLSRAPTSSASVDMLAPEQPPMMPKRQIRSR